MDDEMYEKRVIRALKRIRNNDGISEVNKSHFERFYQRYDVSPARKSIFAEKIRPLLEEFYDITTVDRDDLNHWFYRLCENYAESTMNTYGKVFCQFAKWLNDDMLPKSFSDIRKCASKECLRDLKPSDMHTWNDAMNMIRLTNSIQYQAIVPVQLDAGFRPFEFTNINYGDVYRDGEWLVVYVRKGKTGPRIVALYRSTAYLQIWLDNHPTKKPDDPLWINEVTLVQTGECKAAKASAISARIERLLKNARINKPHDLYSFRHSSCVLDKLDMVPDGLAADRHGHSLQYYQKIYGRLNKAQEVGRFRTHFGMEAKTIANPLDKYRIQHDVLCPTPEQTEAAMKRLVLKQRIKQLEKEYEEVAEETPQITPIPVLQNETPYTSHRTSSIQPHW